MNEDDLYNFTINKWESTTDYSGVNYGNIHDLTNHTHSHTIPNNSYIIHAPAIDYSNQFISYRFDMKDEIENAFKHDDVDVESLTLKEIYDTLVKNKPFLIEYVPQTPERCLIALKTEWSKQIKDKITIPITGDFHRQFLKLKLTKGPLN